MRLLPILLSLMPAFQAFANTGFGACAPVQLPIPRASAINTPSKHLKTDTALYLATFLKASSAPVPPHAPFVSLDCYENMSPALQRAIDESLSSSSGEISIMRLRNMMGDAYLEMRHKRHIDFEIPERLEDFEALSGFRNWRRSIVRESRVKGLTRALYHSPESFHPKISVAVTHESREGDVGRPVRETEILIKRASNSKDWDFYVYGSSGNLQTNSEFKRGTTAPSPAACMSCHYDSTERAFAPLRRF